MIKWIMALYFVFLTVSYGCIDTYFRGRFKLWWEQLGLKFQILIGVRGQKKRKGEALQVFLQKWAREGGSVLWGPKEKYEKIPQYKFYTSLIEQLFIYARQYGAPLDKGLKNLKAGLGRDMRFEAKVYALWQEGGLQFLFCACITWSLIFAVKFYLHYFPTQWEVVIIVGVQFLAWVFYSWIFKYLHFYYFNRLEQMLAALFRFQALLGVGLPLSQALEISQVGRNLQNPVEQIANLQRKLHLALEKLHLRGEGIQQDLWESIEEIWFLIEHYFEKFIKVLGFWRLFFLSCFCFAAYLYYFLLLSLEMLRRNTSLDILNNF